ncbi:MAG: hypothetical protein ACXWC9_11510, partial [Pseudobdellovibrionaceae bacterium]
FDFMTNSLDPERRKSVDEYVRSSPEAQADIQKIQSGLNYADKLRGMEISKELLDKVTVSSSYSQTLLDKIKFDDWSPALKMAIEGTIVALGIATFAVLIPWHKVMDLRFGSRQMILTEVDKAPNSIATAEKETPGKEGEIFPDEGTPLAATTTTLSLAGVATTPSPTPTVTMPQTTETKPVGKPPISAVVPPVDKSRPATAATEKKQGVLFRGVINVTNIQAVTPKLVEKVQELGGRKAGQVELGWFKGDSSYFHFTMPESQYQELQEFFKEYGTLAIQQEPHERVMPEGIRRIIITVYEKK